MKRIEPELESLIRNSDSLSDAARKLGINQTSLRKRLKCRGITNTTMYQTVLKATK
jgi:DNA-binding protein Fis